MAKREERVPFVGKLGGGPGCFTQIELMAALAVAAPAFVDPRSTGMVRTVAVFLDLFAGAACFWAIVQFNWHVLRRLFYDPYGNEIQRSERVGAWLGASAMLTLALLVFPCGALGLLIVNGVAWSFQK